MKKSAVLFFIFFVVSIQNCMGGDQYFFVFLNGKPDKAVLPDSVVKELMKSHFANIGRLVEAGKLVAAGPFAGVGGMFILKLGSFGEADSLLKADDAIKANRWNIEVYPLTITHGNLCKVPEKYEMIQYGFIRYKTNSLATKKLFDRGELKNNFFFTCDFPEKGESVAIGFLKKEELNYNELSAESILYFNNLYIAKGTFCE